MEQNLLEAMRRQIEDREVIWEHHLGLAKNKTYLTNLKAFYDGATTLMDKEKVPCVIYLDCIKAFDMVHHNMFFSKFETYGFDQWTINGWRIGSLPPDGSSQESDVQMEMGDEWCPPGVHLETSPFSIFMNDTDSGINCTSSKFADDQAQRYSWHTWRMGYQTDLDNLE